MAFLRCMSVAELEIDPRSSGVLPVLLVPAVLQPDLGEWWCLLDAVKSVSSESCGLGIECVYGSREGTSGNGKCHHLYELSPFSSLICRLLPLTKLWRNLWSAQTVVFHALDTYVCLVLWWSAGEVKMETTEPEAIFPVAAQFIQMCFLLRAEVQRGLVCLWGVSMQFHSWCVCGGRGIRSEGRVVVMSAMWVWGQGEAFGLLFAILTLEPAAIPACWSIGLSVASNCLPRQLQTKKLKIAI